MNRTKTVFIDPLVPDLGLLREPAGIIASGGLVIVPTETVYGIAANYHSPEAVNRLYQVKKRPSDKPFALLIGKYEFLDSIACDIPIAAYKLMLQFWPGALTLVLRARSGGTIGLRMPDHRVALALLEASGVPVACPSANLSGKSAPLDCAEALLDLDGVVDMAVDSGRSKLAKESSVVDMTGPQARVLREGALSKGEIMRVTQRKNILFVCTGNSCRSVMAQGYLNKLFGDHGKDNAVALSAGIMAVSGGATSATREVLNEEGIDVSAHKARRITPEMIRAADLVLAMERVHEQRILELSPESKNRVFLLMEFAGLGGGGRDIRDPIGGSLDVYRRTFSIIKDAVDKVEKLI